MSLRGIRLPLRRAAQLALIALTSSVLLLTGTTAPATALTAPPQVAPRAVAVPSLVPGTAAFGYRVLRVAAAQRGKPYRYGGNGPRSFDCSGYVRYVMARVGKRLPRTAASMRRATIRIRRVQLRPGDLVFVHKYGRVSHVAIYAGGNRWWEATRPGRPVSLNRAWTRSVSYGRVRR